MQPTAQAVGVVPGIYASPEGAEETAAQGYRRLAAQTPTVVGVLLVSLPAATDRPDTRLNLWSVHKISVPVELKATPRRLAIVWREQMQEFTWPGRSAQTGLALDLEKAAMRREFEQCLEECGTLAFRVARGVLRNAADAEDVAQEAMLRSYRRFARLRDRSRFRAWLVRISFRLALDHGRSTRRREQRETVWATDLPKPTAEDIAASNEFTRRLQNAMEALPEKSRLVLLLTSIDGHSLEEVAELLQVPVGTVKSRLHSARQQLAEKLR